VPSWSSAVLAVSIGVVAAAWNVECIHHRGHRVHRGLQSTEETLGSLSPSTCSSASSVPSVVKVVPDALSRVGLVPSSDPQVTSALVEGATRAFDEARAAGGPDLALVVGGTSTNWSSAASEAVRLACDERVVALIGPPERSLAHPVAQAATRCRVPMLSTSRAASVTAAGSNQVISVVPTGASDVDLPTLARDEWVAAGRDAARAAVEAVRRSGLLCAAFVAAATEATAVTKARETLHSR